MKLKRIAACTVLLLVTFGAGWQLGQREIGTVHAQDVNNITIPKGWGTLKATAINGAAYVFEASDGTVRVVRMDGKLYATAKRE